MTWLVAVLLGINVGALAVNFYTFMRLRDAGEELTATIADFRRRIDALPRVGDTFVSSSARPSQ